MADPIESAIERLRENCLNHSDDIFASQIVSIAIKLCPAGLVNKSDIMEKFEDAIILVDSAREIISRHKVAEKQRH